MDANLSKQLEEIIDRGTRKNPLPIKKGNSIRIGKVIIRYSRHKGYIIFDSENSRQIHLAHSKPGALAIAKLFNEDKDYYCIKNADEVYAKHDNDCIVYESMMEKATTPLKKDLFEIRLGVSEEKREKARIELEGIIFG